MRPLSQLSTSAVLQGTAVTAIVTVAGALILYFSALVDAARDAVVPVETFLQAAAGDAGLVVSETVIEGRYWTPEPVLKEVLRPAHDQVGFLLDLRRLANSVEQLGSVRYAEARFRLPGRLEVRIRERTPFALQRGYGMTLVVDRNGHVLPEVRPERVPDLLIAEGAGAVGALPELLDVLAHQRHFLPEIQTAKRISDRRWTLETVGGVEILLPEQDLEAALNRLETLLRSSGIGIHHLQSVDLRLPAGTAIRFRPPPVEEAMS